MIKYLCDICGKELADNDLIYDVKIEVKAKYKEIEISLRDLLSDHTKEIKELVEKMKGLTPEKLQDDVYKSFSFHLCYECQQRYIKHPLGRKLNGTDIRKRLFEDN